MELLFSILVFSACPLAREAHLGSSPHPLDPLDVPAPHNHPQMADSSPVQRRQYSLRVQQHVELGSDDFAMECDAESSDIFSSAPNTPVKRPLFGPSIPFEQLDPVFLADGEDQDGTFCQGTWMMLYACD